MVDQGAKHLVLIGRSGASSSATQEAVSQLERAGTQVRVIKADVSHPKDIAQVLETVNATMPQLRGIVHAAGVLDNSMLWRQNWEHFRRCSQF